MSPDGRKEVKIKVDGLSREVINWASLKEGYLIFNIDLWEEKNLHYFRGCLRLENFTFD